MNFGDIAIVSLISFAANGALGATWDCTVRAVYQNETGELVKRTGKINLVADVGDRFVLDEATGVLKHSTKSGDSASATLTFNIWQRGTLDNGTAAVYLFKGPVANPAMLFKVFTYLHSDAKPFTYVDETDEVATGTCNMK
jgi:hydroxyethylthiazole kinase-like sugar kinase family protein